MHNSIKSLRREIVALDSKIFELTEMVYEARIAVVYNPYEDDREELVLNLKEAETNLFDAHSRRIKLTEELMCAERLEASRTAVENRMFYQIVGLNGSAEVLA